MTDFSANRRDFLRTAVPVGLASGLLELSLAGLGQGKLQDGLLVEVYDKYRFQSSGNPRRSYLTGKNNQLSGTARQVFDQLADGTIFSSRSNPTEVGLGNSRIKQYHLLELPTTVGNEFQSDAIMFDFVFETEQARNNEIAAAARTVVEQKLAPGEEKTLTISIDTSNKIDVNVFEPFNTELGTASLRSVGGDDDSASLSFVESGQGGGIISFSNIGSGTVMIEYSLTVASDAPDQVYLFQPNMLDLDSQSILIDGIKQMEVVT